MHSVIGCPWTFCTTPSLWLTLWISRRSCSRSSLLLRTPSSNCCLSSDTAASSSCSACRRWALEKKHTNGHAQRYAKRLRAYNQHDTQNWSTNSWLGKKEVTAVQQVELPPHSFRVSDSIISSRLCQCRIVYVFPSAVARAKQLKKINKQMSLYLISHILDFQQERSCLIQERTVCFVLAGHSPVLFFNCMNKLGVELLFFSEDVV